MDDSIFFDEAIIHLRTGKGGDGMCSFRREKFVPLGGPDGGNGGAGGSVDLVANRHLNTLIQFQRRRHFEADPGVRGGSKQMQGRQGKDLRIDVPLGTVVRDAATGEVLADLVQDGQKVLAAKGGRGGRGNAVFKSPTNQAPRIVEKGEPGQVRALKLELKLIADVGITGVPNAGKSTLLAAISAARPKIADYPFTTLTPNLGVATLGEEQTLVLADIPGLIEGAHEGAGLGMRFLRHIERTRVLIHLLDGAAADPLRDFESINAELAFSSAKLAAKPQVVALNKMDLPQAQQLWPVVQSTMGKHGRPVFPISAATGQGTRELLYAVWKTLQQMPEEPPQAAEARVFRAEEDDDAFEITREGKRLEVRGRRVERAAAMTDWNNDESVARFQRILKAAGLLEALIEDGVQPGDTVVIGDHELEWQ